MLIRLVVKGEEGLEHLKILRTLAASDVPENHALPLLAELEKDDMIFAVFPLVAGNPFTRPLTVLFSGLRLSS